jgi:tRNA A37 N6-isopentenylltransferase MiaA
VADTIRLNTWHYAKKQLTWLKKFTSQPQPNLV